MIGNKLLCHLEIVDKDLHKHALAPPLKNKNKKSPYKKERVIYLGPLYKKQVVFNYLTNDIFDVVD